MNMTRAQIVLILCVAAGLVFGQSIVETPRQIIGIQPDMLPCLMVYAGLWGGPLLISLLALVGGLLQDSLSISPLGTSILPLMTVGLAAHGANEVILRDQLQVKCAIGAAACTASSIITLGILIVIGERPTLGIQAVWIIIVQTLYGGFFSPPLFKLLEYLDRTFNHPQAPVMSFRLDREIKRGRM